MNGEHAPLFLLVGAQTGLPTETTASRAVARRWAILARRRGLRGVRVVELPDEAPRADEAAPTHRPR